MSSETQPKIVTITKEDEAALGIKQRNFINQYIEAKFNKNEKTLDQALKPSKQSPLKFNQSKCKLHYLIWNKDDFIIDWPSSKSPEKAQNKFVLKEDTEEAITREDLLAKLAIKIQEEEKEIDLNETSISGSNAKMAKSKKDLSKSLIANLENEFETLKYKRSAAMAVILTFFKNWYKFIGER